MIPHLTSLLEMNRRGEMPMDEIVAHVVKSIALQGNKSDYDDLPSEVREEVSKKLSWYQRAGGWFLVSNSGMENYGEYAERLLRKLGSQSGRM